MKDLRRRTVKQLVSLLTLAALLLLDSARVSAAVTVSSFKAQAQGAAVQLAWTTATEVSNAGFHVLRSTSANGSYTQITASIIPSKCLGCVTGASYSFTDSSASAGQTYYYKLQSVDSRGATHQFGPVSAGSSAPTATPVPSSTPVRTSVPAASPTLSRTNTPVPASSTPTRSTIAVLVPQSVATQPTPLTKVAIAVSGNQPTPIQPASGTRIALNVPPSPQATAVPAMAVVEDESSVDGDAVQAQPSAGANLSLLLNVTVFGLMGVLGCGWLILTVAAFLLYVRATRLE
jgi:hypothetical protein